MDDNDIEFDDSSNNMVSEHNVNTKVNTVNTKVNTETEDSNPDNICDYCHRKFVQKTSLYRHKRLYCKEVKQKKKEQDILQKINTPIMYSEQQMKEIMNYLIKEKDKKLEEFEGKIKSLEQELEQQKQQVAKNVYHNNGTNNNNTHNGYDTHNGDNNTHHGNNTMNNTMNNVGRDQQNINITINSYGNENLDSISKEQWLSILKRNHLALPELIKAIHIDNETNRNLYVPSTKNKYGMVFNGNQWNLREIHDILDEVIDDNLNRIDDYVNDNNQYISDRLIEKLDRMINDSSQLNNVNNARTKHYQRVKTMLIENKNIVKDTYEKLYGKKINNY